MLAEKIKHNIEGVREKIIDDPSQANAIYRARVDLVEGVKCVATAQSSDPLSFDEPVGPNMGLGCKVDSGGKELGMVPAELFLVSIGSCIAIGFGAFAALHDVVLHQVSVKLSGYFDARGFLGLDESVPLSFTRIEYSVTVRSTAEEDLLREVTRLAVERSPILKNVSSEIEVHGTVTVNDVVFMRCCVHGCAPGRINRMHFRTRHTLRNLRGAVVINISV
jgi:uncharacterized OsmC-like protein